MSLKQAKSASEFYKIVRANYKHFAIHNISMPSELHKTKAHLIASMPSTQFLDYSFATDYIRLCKYYYRMTCNDCVFHIVSRGRPDITDIKQTINDVMNAKLLYDISKPLTFYICMNPAKRYFAKQGEIMQAKHINGGFTNPYSNQIYIVRKQEYAKVMLHELLHHCNAINKHDWHPSNVNKLKRHFNIRPDCKFYPNEAVVETVAYMLYICFISLHRKQSFNKLLKKEKEHSCALANKVIRMQNNKPWYEETNTYCYIVLKCILFSNFNTFITTIRDENQTSEILLTKKISLSKLYVQKLKLVKSYG